MKRSATVLAIVAVESLAHAGPSAEVRDLTQTAKHLAQHHDCDAIGDVAVRVRRLDPAFFSASFVADADIAACGIEVAAAGPRDEPAPTTTRDRTTALALGVIPTLASGALLGVGVALGRDGTPVTVAGSIGLMVAPSFGHFYAGDGLTPWLATRLVTSAVSTGVILALASTDGPEVFAGTSPHRDAYVATAVIGGAAYLTGVVGDLVTAPAAVDARNARVKVVPSPIATPTGITPGIGLMGEF